MNAPPPYQLTWVTEHLAVGCAPMSRAQLDSIRDQGVAAILNLCAEFCDLHELEAEAGFEVRYLPIPDEEAPDLADLEQALAWLDEAVYLEKKVLIHCRHGLGRTGTVLNAYLLRRGLGHRNAGRILRPLRSKPANFDQWWTIRKYGRKSGRLTIREPRLEFDRLVDLGPFFEDLRALYALADDRAGRAGQTARCGRDHVRCCRRPPDLPFIEAVRLGHAVNASLDGETRLEVIARAGNAEEGAPCPLLRGAACLLFEHRPYACRVFGLDAAAADALRRETAGPALEDLSRHALFAFTSETTEAPPPSFSLRDVVSGKYAQAFFHFLSRLENEE